MRALEHHSYRHKLFLIAGVLLLCSLFVYELRPGHGLITITYLIVLPFILLLSDRKRYAIFIGLLTTLFIIAGFILSDLNGKSILTNNRILAGIAIWMIVCFSVWYRNVLRKEQNTKKHLSAIFDNATEGIIVTNSGGEISMINSYALALFGYSENELIGKKIEQLIPDRFVEKHHAHRNNFNNSPRNRPMGEGMELYAKRKDNSEFPAEISLGHFSDYKDSLAIAFIKDITERKKYMEKIHRLNEELEERVQDRTKKLSDAYHIMENTNADLKREITARETAEQKLLHTQHLYETMARHFPNGIIGIMNSELKYLLVNGTGLQEMDAEEKKLLEEKVLERLRTINKFDKVDKPNNGLSIEPAHFEVVLKNNYYSVKAVSLPEREGMEDKILIVITNVSTEKRNEISLMKNLEREKELGKMKTRFVSTASHEFRTPLSTILTSAFLLKNYTGKDYENVKDTHILRIKNSVNNLTDILNDFLSLSKLDEGKVELSFAITDIQFFLLEIKKEMEMQKHSHQVIEYTHHGSNTVETDKKVLRIIMLNVLSNAIKYSKSDGIIKISSVIKSGKLIIKVKDHGIGIPAEELPHIFKRFFRAENASYIQGTGLGLNIVKKYVKLLNGSINCKSKLNSGSTFTIELPVVAVSKEMTIEEFNL